jgi:hypothetical protein
MGIPTDTRKVFMLTEIAVFKPNSREKHVVIESLIPTAAVSALAERFNQDLADKAQKIINSMKRNDVEMTQMRFEDRRVRIRLG